MKKLIIIAKFIFLFGIQNQYSQGESLPANISREDVQQEQRERLKSEINQRNLLQRQTIIQHQDEIIEKELDTACQFIKTIQLQGINRISHKDQQKIISPYQSRCLNIKEIENIRNEITNAYIKQGYITSLAYLPEQDLIHQYLNIQVIEGRIESIKINTHKSKKISQRLVSMAFPNLVGKILNLRDLEQGLEQLNRLATVKYTLEIQPGIRQGYSHVVLHEQASKIPISLRFNLDNSGANETGSEQFSGTLLGDSLVGLGEQWTLSANTDIGMRSSHYSRYFGASLNLPYGYWSYRYQFFHQQSSQLFTVNHNKYPYKSKNIHQQFDASYLLYRDTYQRITLHGGLKHKRVQTQLAGQALTISSPTLTSVFFSPQYSTVINQGYFTLNPSIEWGIYAFGAVPDLIAENSPRSHYRKLNLSSSYQYPIKNNLNYLTSFYSQYTPDNLYAIERLNIGSQYSIRGYQDQSINGNSGLYWRNEINRQINNKFGMFNLILALDYGYIIPDKYEIEGGTLAGGAMGVSYINNTLSSSLLISKPFYYSAEIKPSKWSLYWSISFDL